MNTDCEKLIARLIEDAKRKLVAPRVALDFETGIPEAEEMLNDIEHHSHIFVLACVMDKQIRAGRAWAIPYLVGRKLGGFDFATYRGVDLSRISEFFNKLKLHRFNNEMAKSFHAAIHDIDIKYGGDTSKIWREPPCPKSALVVRRFLEFRGVVGKIATMATNILARDFKIPMCDHSSIDISPDIQVRKFFVANGLLNATAKKEELIYRARELCPEYPGLLDLASWEGGRKLPRKSERL